MTAEIKGIEKVEEVMGYWSPRSLAIIKNLELKSDRLVIDALFQATAKSWPDFSKEMFRVVIVFDGVGNLQMKGFGGGPVQIMGFDIHFVGDRGLEGINYEIEDYEDNRISFFCRGISIQSATIAVNDALEE